MRVINLKQLFMSKKKGLKEVPSEVSLESTEMDTTQELQEATPETTDATEVPEFTESTVTEEVKVGWDLMREYLSQSEEVEPEIKDLMERYKDTHAVRVYKSDDGSRWELFMVHRSSLPTHQTCQTLRQLMESSSTTTWGFHTWVYGSKEEVLQQVTAL